MTEEQRRREEAMEQRMRVRLFGHGWGHNGVAIAVSQLVNEESFAYLLVTKVAH